MVCRVVTTPGSVTARKGRSIEMCIRDSYQGLKDDENWRIDAPLRRRTLFAPARHGVYFVQRGGGEAQPPTLRFYRYSDRSIQVVYTFPGPDLFWGLTLSPDERSILYSQMDSDNTDVLVINEFR